MLFSHPQCLAVLSPCYCRPAAAYPTFTQLNPRINRHERKHGASYGFKKKNVYINETYREREGNFLQRKQKGMCSYVQFSVLLTETSQVYSYYATWFSCSGGGPHHKKQIVNAFT